MTTKKAIKANGNDSSVRDDLHAAHGSFFLVQCALETVHGALVSADESNDGEGVTMAINALRTGLDALDAASEDLDRVAMRLFREGCPPEDVKKLQRESTPPAIHILRSSRTSAQKVKALQKVMRVSAS